MLDSKTHATHLLPPLPYENGALEPIISARALAVHYGQHHAGYVERLNELTEDTAYAGLPLVEVVLRTSKHAAARTIFNNAAQAWNHEFFWRSMGPNGGGKPGGNLRSAIDRDFGSIEEFRTAFAKVAAGAFGSGWTWLVLGKDGKLAIAATENADTPLVSGDKPLLVIDVWEHAYYLDYQSRRSEYIAAWLDSLVDWQFAEANFAAASVS